MSGQRVLCYGDLLFQKWKCAVCLQGTWKEGVGWPRGMPKHDPGAHQSVLCGPQLSHPLSLTLRFLICDSGRIQNACQCYFFTEAGFWNLSDSLGSGCLECLPGCSAKTKWASETQMWQGAAFGNRRWESSEHGSGSQQSSEVSDVCNRQRPAASLSLRWRQHLWRDDSFWQIILGTL